MDKNEKLVLENKLQERLDNILTNRLYLIDKTEKNNQYEFKIEGSTGKTYNVKIGNKISCQCPDHKFRHSRGIICKHILFIVNSSNNKDAMEYLIKNGIKTSDLLSKFPELFSKESTNINDNENDPCPICYEIYGKEHLFKCSTCSYKFHVQCISVWKKTKKTCPMCRSIF